VKSFVSLQFLNRNTVGRTPWMEDQSVARRLPANRTTQNKRTQTSMSLVGFEPTIPVLERAKTVHALDPAATVIGNEILYLTKLRVSRMEIEMKIIYTVCLFGGYSISIVSREISYYNRRDQLYLQLQSPLISEILISIMMMIIFLTCDII
jgi:hypothetical protein